MSGLVTDREEFTEQVAEAIWRAGYPRESADRTWRDLVNKTHYRTMAQAAIGVMVERLKPPF